MGRLTARRREGLGVARGLVGLALARLEELGVREGGLSRREDRARELLELVMRKLAVEDRGPSPVRVARARGMKRSGGKFLPRGG